MNFPGFVNIAYADVGDLIAKINTVIINPAIIFIFALALAYFVYGVFVYMKDADNEEERAKGRQQMLWGVIGMFIMLSVFGIMKIIISTIGAKGINVETGQVNLPQ
jgi:hypothetical protein